MGFVTKKPISIGLPITMADWLREYSEDTGIPMGRLVKDAIQEKYGDKIEEWENQNKKD